MIYIILGVRTHTSSVISTRIFPVKVNAVEAIAAHKLNEAVDELLAVARAADHIAECILSRTGIGEGPAADRDPSLETRLLALQGGETTVE